MLVRELNMLTEVEAVGNLLEIAEGNDLVRVIVFVSFTM